jgi:hypothetical protein
MTDQVVGLRNGWILAGLDPVDFNARLAEHDAQILERAADDMDVIYGMARTPVRELLHDELVAFRDHALSSVMDSSDLKLVAEWLREQAVEARESAGS